MAYEITLFQLPCGARAARLVWQGLITGEDALAMYKQTTPGGPLHGLPRLVVNAKTATPSAEARSIFAHQRDGEWVALVMSNVVMRVAVSFVIRIRGTRRLRLFAGEAEAVQWLDARAREDQARAAKAEEGRS